MIDIPLSAVINGERIIGQELSEEEWSELKLRHKKGLPVIMACCGQAGHLRTSKNGLKHFYHAHKSDDCGGEPETLDHLQLKYQIYQICKSEGWDAQPEYQSPNGDWRADVYAKRDEKQIVFEIQLSIINQEDLKIRDQKYHRDGIESYWILKDYLNIHPYDNVDSDDNPGIFIDTYINEAEFSLNREQLYSIKKGIRTIGIKLPSRLYTTTNSSIDLTEWVRNTLNGEYSQFLSKTETKYREQKKLRKLARPAMAELNHLEQNYYGYKEDVKRLYAIFMNNTWDNRPSLKQEIQLMYTYLKSFKDAFWKVFSPKNGFLWKNYPDSERKYRELQLISEIQINSIQDQINHVKDEETKFLSVFNSLKEYLEKNKKDIKPVFLDTNKQDKPLPNNKPLEEYFKPQEPNINSDVPEEGLHLKSLPDYSDYYRREIPLSESRRLRVNIKDSKQDQYSKSLEQNINRGSQKEPNKKPNELLFEFSRILPSLVIQSQRGHQYQNPAGAKFHINEADALEFEQRGLGKIIRGTSADISSNNH